MKENLKKLKYNIWFYFILFAVIIMVIVWFTLVATFELSFLRSKYVIMLEQNKVVKEHLEEGLDETTVSGLYNADINLYIVDGVEEGLVYVAFPEKEILKAGEGIANLLIDGVNSLDVKDKHNSFAKYKVGDKYYCYYAEKCQISGFDCYLIYYTSMASMSETLNIIQGQLFISAIIILILSLVFAFIISGWLSEPVDKMSRTAKNWANGDQTVRFEGGSYQEIDELAETLNYAKEEVGKSSKLQRDILANVSHDLKTPLTLIKSYAEMIKDISGDNKEKREKHTEVIIDEADRLTLLVNDILDLSKLQSDSAIKNDVVLNLSELVEKTASRFANALSEYKIECHIEEDIKIFADEKRIEQVIYNLVGNSINYTGEDKTVRIYLTKKEGYALFEIIDSGKGMDEEQVETIWDKYRRISETHHRPVGGTGLGLSIVKTVLDSYKLDYGVITKKEVGSNFYIKFKEAEEDE